MFSSTEVFEEGTGLDEMSARAYMFVLGLYVTGGLAVSAYVASLTYTWQVTNIWLFLLIGLVIPIIGIVISAKSENWLISTFGYAMVFVPFGAILGPVVALYQMESVIQAVVVTLVLSAGLWIVGTLIPPIVSNWTSYIIGALLVLIAGDLARGLMPLFGLHPVTLGVWPWVGIVLFSGLIVYDVNKAMQMPKNLDNAVDGAVALYLDVVNIFIRVLEIMGKKDD